MPILVNLRHLEAHSVDLSGALAAAELDIDTRDEVVRVKRPLEYSLEVLAVELGLLVTGQLRLVLDCQCVRCLKAFACELKLPHWTLHVPLQGEDAAPVSNDCVDLTPYVREDILLEFPPHPLCAAECRGLPRTNAGEASSGGQLETVPSAWSELNKLKFK